MFDDPEKPEEPRVAGKIPAAPVPRTAQDIMQRRALAVQSMRELAKPGPDGLPHVDSKDQEAFDRYTQQVETCTRDLKNLEILNAQQGILESEEAAQEERARRTRDLTGQPETPAPGGADREIRQRKAFSAELRALSVGVQTQGGYLTMPQMLINTIIKQASAITAIRGLAKVIPGERGQSIGIPILTNPMGKPKWVGELETGDDDTSLAFGKREMRPHPLALKIKVSRLLLASRFIDVEAEVLNEISKAFADASEDAYINGDGQGQPLGVMTPSDDGIPTSQDFATHATSSAMTSDQLIACKYKLRPPYHRNARWLFHQDAMGMIRLFKDSNGQYIWQQSLQEGQPDRLLGFPVELSESMPNTFTTGKYVGLLGDFSYYQILDAMGVEIGRFDELLALKNLVLFITRYEGDGAPVLAEAFVRIKLG